MMYHKLGKSIYYTLSIGLRYASLMFYLFILCIITNVRGTKNKTKNKTMKCGLPSFRKILEKA